MAENETKRDAWTDQQDTPQAKKISDIWKEFSGNCTLHGLKNAVLSRSVYLRVAWSLAVLGALAYLLYSIMRSWSRYLEYGTTIQVFKNLTSSLVFPTVTICSTSTADKKKIFTHDNDPDFNYYGLNISACAATADVRAEMNVSCGYALLCACARTLLNVPLIGGCDESIQGKILHALKSHQVNYNDEEFFLTFSQTWSEMVHWCYYGLNFIDCRPLFKPLITYHGVCYVFNSNVTNLLKSRYPGVKGGLGIALRTRLDRAYYPKKFSDGFTVFVNEHTDDLPETGINAGSGLLSSISLSMVKYKFLKHPYGAKCGSRKLKGAPFYSQSACVGECWSDYIYEACACRPVGYGEPNDSITCYSIHTNCTSRATVMFDYSCDCPVACEVTTYGTEVTYGSLPDKSVEGVRQLFYDIYYSRENYALIEIGFKQLSYTQQEEKFAFEKTSLLGIEHAAGEVGGNMGLLLGCSVLTLLEFVDFLFSLLMLRLQRNNVGVH